MYYVRLTVGARNSKSQTICNDWWRLFKWLKFFYLCIFLPILILVFLIIFSFQVSFSLVLLLFSELDCGKRYIEHKTIYPILIRIVFGFLICPLVHNQFEFKNRMLFYFPSISRSIDRNFLAELTARGRGRDWPFAGQFDWFIFLFEFCILDYYEFVCLTKTFRIARQLQQH